MAIIKHAEANPPRFPIYRSALGDGYNHKRDVIMLIRISRLSEGEGP